MEDLRRSDEEHDPIAYAEDWLLKWSTGYGYHPMWAFWEIVASSTVGWIIYRRSYLAGTMLPSDKEAHEEFTKPKGGILPHYPKFSPLIYSVENSLPLVKLGQADKWQPVAPGQTAPPHKRPATELAYRVNWEWVSPKLRGAAQALLRGLAGMWDRAPEWMQKCWKWTSARPTVPRFVMWFLWIQILLGWLLATLFVAGVSGIVHKE
jgi:hypothetical protein